MFMKRKLPILFLLIGMLSFTSCGTPSKGITPGKLPKGGTEITAEEMVTKINELDTTYKDVDNYYCSLNIEDISFISNSNLKITSGNKTHTYTAANEFGLSGMFEIAKNTIKSDDKIQTNAYIKFNDFSFKYKAEASEDNTIGSTTTSTNVDYSNMSAAAYLTNNNLYLDLSNDNTMKLVNDIMKSETNDIPSRLVIEDISKIIENITIPSSADDTTSSFDFNSIDMNATLVSLKEKFGDSISYQSFGENGFGIAISITKEKMINYIVEEYIKENYGTDKKYDDLTEEEKEVILEYTNQYTFNATEVSVYFDGNNKKMEFATDIDISSNMKIKETNTTGTNKNSFTLKLSSSIELKEKEITFPLDLNEYQILSKESIAALISVFL